MGNKAVQVIRDSAITVLLLSGATALSWMLQSWGLRISDIVIVYLLSVLLTACLTHGHTYGLIGSILSFLLFNWFFTEPFFSLKIYDPSNIITVAIMTGTATITSTLTSKVKQAAAEARAKEAESNSLYQMTNHLTDAADCDAIASITVRTVSEILGCSASCIYYGEDGSPMPTFIQQKSDGTQVHREVDDGQELRQRMEHLHAPVDMGPEFYDFPIYGQTMVLAILRIPTETASGLSEQQLRLVHAMIESAALAMERFRSLQAQARIREEQTQEHYRGNLLRAISHDLRTPLAGIMGTSEMLMGMTEKTDPRYSMAEDIYQDADWLHALVENILNLTKFQDGRLALDKQPEAIEEVIGAALMVMEKRLPGRKIDIDMPESVILVPVDARLITQVLVNLLDNAAKHTPDDREIAISVREAVGRVEITVADRGCGIDPKVLPHVFQMFYTTPGLSADAKPGVGLGLTICQSIVEAHGGTIQAENRPGGGAAFTFTIPTGGEEA